MVVVSASQQHRYSIHVAAPQGLIALLCNGEHVADLKVEYYCTHDTAKD